MSPNRCKGCPRSIQTGGAATTQAAAGDEAAEAAPTVALPGKLSALQGKVEHRRYRGCGPGHHRAADRGHAMVFLRFRRGIDKFVGLGRSSGHRGG